MFRLMLLVVVGTAVWYVTQSDDLSASTPLTESVLSTQTASPQFVRAETPVLDASAYVVMDAATGEVLYSNNPETMLPIASITKLVTAAFIAEQSDKNLPVRVTAADVATEGPFGKLSVGHEYTPYETLFPLLIESSNDAGAVILRTYQSEWQESVAAILTRAGVEASMRIVEPTGLSDRNEASALAVADFTRHLLATKSHLLDITRLPYYVSEYTSLANNNPLHSERGYQGGKHGYTEAANRTITAVFTEDIAGQERSVIYVVLGTDSLVPAIRTLRSTVAATRVEQ